MNTLQAINTGLNKGLIGIINAYIAQYRYDLEPAANQTRRIRLSIKFKPIFDTIGDRMMRSLQFKKSSPRTIEDTLFDRPATIFLHMLAVAEEIVACKDKDLSNLSVWLTFDGDAYSSDYFLLQICSKDGKKVITSSNIHGLEL